MSSTKVPWLDLVRFHREVLRRGEEAFYSLRDTENGRDRWGELLNFRPDSLAGPWTVSFSEISHEAFARRIKSEEITELYLGGPCWHRRQNYRGNWFSAWSPVICREVRLEVIEDDRVRLEPQQGKWDVSPPLFDLLERMSVQPEKELDALIPELIEQAVSVSESEDSVDLVDHFETLLGRHIPELGEKLEEEPRSYDAEPLRSGWTLFVPPAGVSVYIRYLMRDYQKLEQQLEASEENVGGLELLEPGTAQYEESADEQEIRPIVPLNEQQERAVGEILGNKPVTVISGPPGCGKSQVVVSTILNAWAEGKKVLFASTTNQAVEVVKERLEEFEEEVPISVRAGRRRYNNVEESLQRTLQLASLDEDRLEDPEIDRTREELLTREKELEEALNSDLPQRISESLRSSVRAYGQHQEIKAEINQTNATFRSRIRELGFDTSPSDLEQKVLGPLDQWLGQKETVEAKIAQDETERQEIETEIQTAKTGRNQAVEKVGLEANSVSSWDWLEQGPSPELLEDWFERYRDFLQKPIGEDLAPISWESQYERWEGSEHADRWLDAARDLAEQIRSEVRRLGSTLEEINTVRSRRQEAIRRLEKHGLSEQVSFEPEVVREWNAAYATLRSLPDSFWDWLPWSQKSRERRKLKRLERKLRATLPLSVWREVGELDEEGRDRLSEVLEDVDHYLQIGMRWEGLSSERSEVRSSFQSLREKVNQIKGAPLPDSDWDVEAWLEAASNLEGQINLAQAARTAWEKREKKRQVEGKLSKLVGKWKSIASGIPIKNAWEQGEGEGFSRSVRRLATEPTPEDVEDARSSAYTSPFSELVSNWKQAREDQTTIRELRQSKSSIPSREERIRTWYEGSPSFANLDRRSLETLPSEDDRLFRLRDEVEEIVEEWEEFENETRPGLREEAKSELQWAEEHLEKTLKMRIKS